jgi:hypothetical protein
MVLLVAIKTAVTRGRSLALSAMTIWEPTCLQKHEPLAFGHAT